MQIGATVNVDELDSREASMLQEIATEINNKQIAKSKLGIK
jgi:FixJ family two-component response regulator